MQFTFLDVVLIFIILSSVFFGFRKGLIVEVFWLLGIIAGLVIGLYYQDKLTEFLEARFHIPLVVNRGASYLIIFFSSILIFSILSRFITFTSQSSSTLTFGNRIGGALFGLARGVIITSLILIWILQSSLPPSIHMCIYNSEFSCFLVNYSTRFYEKILLTLPGEKTFSKINIFIDYSTAEKIKDLKKLNSNIYEELLDRFTAEDFQKKDIRNIVPEEIEKLRMKREGRK